MNIKKSLYIPIILTIISLFFAVVIFLYSSNLANKSNQQTLIYNERIKELYAITDLRKNLISQFNLISENLISLEDGDINRFNEISKSSKKAFEYWNSTIQAQLSFNMNTEEAENVYNAAYKNYNEALKLTTLAINSIERDNIEESLIYVEKEIKPKLNQEIFPTLDQYTEKLKTKISNSTTAGSSPRSLLNILTILLLILLSVSIYFYLKTLICLKN